MNVVKLSVHKNTMERRKSKALRKEAATRLKESTNQSDLVGYAIVTWNKDGKVTSCSNTGTGVITQATLPETLKSVFLDRFITD